MSGWTARLLHTVASGVGTGVAPALVAKQAFSAIANHLVDSKPEFDRLVLGALRRTCAGASLMLGYTSPGATFLRKTCEALPDAIDGVMKSLISVTFTVPFVHCICVASEGNAYHFETHATTECYGFAPDSLKGFVLDVIDGVRNGGTQEAACKAMVDLARTELEVSDFSLLLSAPQPA